MPGLLETASSLAITAVMIASTLGAVAGAARVSMQSVKLTAELFAQRQLEHLFDRAALAAGAGPGHPAPVAAADAGHVVLHADLNGDGKIDANGSETTTLEVIRQGAGVRVRHRLGKQTMTLLDLDHAEGELTPRDRHGSPSGAGTTTLIELRLQTSASAAPGSWLFAVPAAVGP